MWFIIIIFCYFTDPGCSVFEDKLKAALVNVVFTLINWGWQDSAAVSSPSGGRLR